MTWLPPPVERANGRIVYYKVFYVQMGRSDSEATVTTLNGTNIVLDELKRWTEYRIWVLAGTSVGDGPRSYPITVRTLEDGTYSQFSTVFLSFFFVTILQHYIFIALTFFTNIKCLMKFLIKCMFAYNNYVL